MMSNSFFVLPAFTPHTLHPTHFLCKNCAQGTFLHFEICAQGTFLQKYLHNSKIFSTFAHKLKIAVILIPSNLPFKGGVRCSPKSIATASSKQACNQ